MKNNDEVSTGEVVKWFQIIPLFIICATIAGIEIVAALKIGFMDSMERIALFNSFLWILVLVTSYLDRRRLRELEGEKTYKQANRFFLLLAISSVVTGWKYIKINLFLSAAMFILMSVGILVPMFFQYKERTAPTTALPPM